MKLKPGQSFTVTGERDRQYAQRAAKVLWRAEMIKFEVRTEYLSANKFKVEAY